MSGFSATLAAVEGVEGWMTDAQARRLWDGASAVPAGGRIVEIGSFRGRSTIVLATAATAHEGVEVVAIDPHAGNDRGPQEISGYQDAADEKKREKPRGQRRFVQLNTENSSDVLVLPGDWIQMHVVFDATKKEKIIRDLKVTVEGDAVENMAVLTMPVRTELSFDLNAGNDTCPLLGNHDGDESKFVIASDPAIGKPPFICDRLPQFVEMRGGEYFFVPSMNALRMMGIGTVDPT